MKTNLTAQNLVKAGAHLVGTFSPHREDNIKFVFAHGKDTTDLGKKGFYIITKSGVAVAKTFAADQESRLGFNDTRNRVLACSYSNKITGMPMIVGNEVIDGRKDHNVYYIPLDNASRLINVQQLELFGENRKKDQSFTAVSRQLFKVYNFEYQKR